MKPWAPWRIEYIKAPKARGCIFCKFQKKKPGEFPLLMKTKYSMVVMNEYPYNPGHVMVAPLRHVPDIDQLDEGEFVDLWESVRIMECVIKGAVSPDGMNIGVNIGRDAGAGIAGHVHVHIVPRWRSDSNFMPVVADTRVISQSLQDSFDLLFSEIRRGKCGGSR